MTCHCLDCHFLGYRREETEKARSEPGRIVLGTVHRFPESLPTETRRLLLQDDRPRVEQSLLSLRASENQLTCLRVGADGTPLNSELPALRPIPEQFASMRSSILRERDCGTFRPVDPSMPYSVLKDIEEARGRATALEGALRQARLKQLASHRQAFLALEESTLSPQARGTALESWLRELLRLYEVDPVLNVVNPGEQVDVTFWFGQLFVLGEVRWRGSPMDALLFLEPYDGEFLAEGWPQNYVYAFWTLGAAVLAWKTTRTRAAGPQNNEMQRTKPAQAMELRR